MNARQKDNRYFKEEYSLNETLSFSSFAYDLRLQLTALLNVY